jgi:hypothetical protein
LLQPLEQESEPYRKSCPLFLKETGSLAFPHEKPCKFFVAPVLSVPASLRHGEVEKRNIFPSQNLALLLEFLLQLPQDCQLRFPHDHNTETGRIWFESQPQDVQEKIRTFANETSQTVDEVTQSLCSSDPNVRKRMEKLQKPPYTRVYEYIKG